MVNKSSFGRGFNSSILNSYVLSLVLCIAIAITLFVLSILNNSFIKNARYSVISIGKPFFIIVAKPFQLINESLIYLSEIKDSNQLMKKLIEENTLLKKQLDKNIKTDNKLEELFQSLKEINAKLWVIEDDKRQCEKDKNFGEKFIKLSRDVHFLNDDRAKIKLEINNHTGSVIKEIKEYTSY